MKKVILQSMLIVVIAAALSGLSYLLRPEALHLDMSELEIDLGAARALKGATWVDARVEEDFKASHFEGAICLNEENWELSFISLLDAWVPGTPIVVYCSSQACLRSHHVAERLRTELGSDEIFALQGGWEALQAAGLEEGGTR